MAALKTLQSLVKQLPAYDERPALGLRQEYGARWWSYRRLYDEAYRFAAFLQSQEIAHGDCILIWCGNCPEWAAALLGAALRSAIVVPADADSSAAYVQRLVDETDARLVLHAGQPGADQLSIRSRPLLAAAEEPMPERLEDVLLPAEPDDTAVVFYTSGTTTEPKGVVLTHRNLMAQIEHFRMWRWLLRVIPVRMLVLSPLSHVQGLMLGVCVPLAIGMSVLYSTSVDPAHVFRMIKQNRISVLVAAPRLQHLLAQTIQQMPYKDTGMTLAEKAGQIRWFTLRRRFWHRRTRALFGRRFWVLVVGGAALPPGDERFWFESIYFLAHGYGLTETSAIVSFHLNTPFRRPTRSVGKPLAHNTVRIADDGEILVRGATVTPGLYRTIHGSAASLVNEEGFLRTGDLARRDADGRLYFLGRKGEIIVTTEGFNVYPQDVESVLHQLPLVRDAVVVGLQVDGREEVHAVLSLHDPAAAAESVQQANARLEPHQRIRSWTIWPEADFPRTTLLKVRRRAVAEMIQSGEMVQSTRREEHAAPTLQSILDERDRGARLDLIVRYLMETPPDQLSTVHATLVNDLGLSSLDVVELLSRLEQRAHVVLDNRIVHEQTSLAHLRRMMEGAKGAESTPHLYRSSPWVGRRGPVRLLHRWLTPLVIPPWFALHARLHVRGAEHLASVQGPLIFAGAHHEHGMDVMAVYCALPRHLRNRLLVVTANETFREYLEPSPGIPWVRRLYMGWAFHVGVPLFFPLTLWPHYGITRQGLMDACGLVEEGFSPLIFPEHMLAAAGDPIQPGVGWIAAQTQTSVLPLRLFGNDGIDFLHSRRRNREVTVSFGAPIYVRPETPPEAITEAVQDALQRL